MLGISWRNLICERMRSATTTQHQVESTETAKVQYVDRSQEEEEICSAAGSRIGDARSGGGASAKETSLSGKKPSSTLSTGSVFVVSRLRCISAGPYSSGRWRGYLKRDYLLQFNLLFPVRKRGGMRSL